MACGSDQDGGASPLFPPAHATAEGARAALLHLVRRDPHSCGLDRSRWRLADVLAHCAWLGLRTPQGLGQLLARLGIGYKRGRDYLHSPDPDYDAKLAAISTAHQTARDEPAHQVLLYLDEMTLYRHPTLARAWEAVGGGQPLARRSYRGATPTRVLGALDAVSAQVHHRRPDKITIAALLRFFQALVAAYPPRCAGGAGPANLPLPTLSPRQLGARAIAASGCALG
jgi:hypothetical protein